MLTVDHTSTLPGDVPLVVRLAVDLCMEVESTVHDQFPWGRTPGLLVTFWRKGRSQVGAEVAPLLGGDDDGAHSTVQALEALLAEYPFRPPRPRAVRVGLGVLTEGLTLRDDVVAPAVDDHRQLADWYADSVAAGHARQFRTLLGDVGSGWRIRIRRARHGSGEAEVSLFVPGEAPEDPQDDEDLFAVLARERARWAS